MSITTEFDNTYKFEDEVLALLSEGCEDSSWHNDESPSIARYWKVDDDDYAVQARLWVNMTDPVARAEAYGDTGWDRYMITVHAESAALEDWLAAETGVDIGDEYLSTENTKVAVEAFVKLVGMIHRALTRKG